MKKLLTKAGLQESAERDEFYLEKGRGVKEKRGKRTSLASNERSLGGEELVISSSIGKRTAIEKESRRAACISREKSVCL